MINPSHNRTMMDHTIHSTDLSDYANQWVALSPDHDVVLYADDLPGLCDEIARTDEQILIVLHITQDLLGKD